MVIRVYEGGGSTLIFLYLSVLPTSVKNASCDNTYNNTSEGYGQIHSPGYPSKYPNQANCAWLIESSARVRLVSVDFRTERSYDSVRVYDGSTKMSTQLRSYSGTKDDVTVESSGPTLFVTFTSDGSANDMGFVFNYGGELTFT